MRRARVWIIFGVALIGLLAVALAALPAIVRRLAISQAAAATGRSVAIDDLALNLFTRRLSITGFRLADRNDAATGTDRIRAAPAGDRTGVAPGADRTRAAPASDQPSVAPAVEQSTTPVEFQRFEARFRLLPLLSGRIYLETASLHGPVIRVVRTGPESFNISDVLARLLRKERAAKPFDFTIEHLAIAGGAVTFEDRAVSPPRTWELVGLTADLRAITTAAEAAGGTAAASFTLAGAPVSVTADQIGVRPAHARATVTLTGLDLGGFATYIPANAAVRLEGGRFSTRLDLRYDGAGLHAMGNATASDLRLGRRGQAEAFVTTPDLQMTSRDVTYKDGRITAGHLELVGDPSILDTSVSPPQRFDLRGVRLSVDDASYPTRAPARVAVVATLPSQGSVDARGSAALFPAVADLMVRIADADLALFRPYIPEVSPITLEQGRLDAELRVQRDSGTDLRLNGTARVARGVLNRRGQAEPFVSHPRLDVAVTDLTLQGANLAIKRLEMAGEPTIVDASVSPPQRFTLTPLKGEFENATWPSQGPATVRVTAADADGGTLSIQGTMDPGTLGADVRVLVGDLDLTRLPAYLPAGTPVVPQRGRLKATFRFRNDAAAGTRVGGDGMLVDVAFQRRDDSEPFLTAPTLSLALQDLVVRGGTVTIDKATITGNPTVVDATLSPPAPLPLTAVRLALEELTWPARRPVTVRLVAKLPESGTLTLAGTAALDARRADMQLVLEEAALAPFQRQLRLGAPVGGRVNAELDLSASLAGPIGVKATGIATVNELALGSVDRPPITVERAAATGIEVAWPARISVERLIVAKPFALIERERDGGFPLRTMLTPADAEATAASPVGTSANDEASAGDPKTGGKTTGPSAGERKPDATMTGPTPEERTAEAKMTFTLDEVQIIDGEARFVDRSTTPFYSEEMSRLTVTIRDLSNAPGERAQVNLQGILGANAALDLQGEVAPFGEPFFLDMAGELREFAVPRVNPYLQRVLDWIARTGRVTTRVHYRIVGDQLEATNDLMVERLSVERAADGADADKRVGLPLGLAVALLKDSHGDIKLSVPVSGRLSAPEFSFGDAFATALRNVVTRLVTGPFRAIGKIFRKDDQVEAVAIDPIEFDPGSAVITPEMEKQLQRVADFLRASPYVKLTMAAVVSARDVSSLKTQEVTARIQAVQREQRLANFAEAAVHLFRERHPDQPVPKTVDDIVDTLRDEASAPTEPARRLAERRLETTRQTLIREAGIPADRLIADPAPTATVATGSGRVEFELQT